MSENNVFISTESFELTLSEDAGQIFDGIVVDEASPYLGVSIVATSGGWSRVFGSVNAAKDTQLGGWGVFGSSDTLSYLWAGSAYTAAAIYVFPSTQNLAIGASTINVGDGTKCLAMTAVGATAPTAIGTNSMVFYCDTVGAIGGAPHFYCSDGNIMKLYRNAALTTKDAGVANSGDATTDGVIDNNRTRIEEIETILSNLGILP